MLAETAENSFFPICHCLSLSAWTNLAFGIFPPTLSFASPLPLFLSFFPSFSLSLSLCQENNNKKPHERRGCPVASPSKSAGCCRDAVGRGRICLKHFCFSWYVRQKMSNHSNTWSCQTAKFMQKLECLVALCHALLSHDVHVCLMWIIVSKKAAWRPNLVNSPSHRWGWRVRGPKNWNLQNQESRNIKMSKTRTTFVDQNGHQRLGMLQLWPPLTQLTVSPKAAFCSA